MTGGPFDTMRLSPFFRTVGSQRSYCGPVIGNRVSLFFPGASVTYVALSHGARVMAAAVCSVHGGKV